MCELFGASLNRPMDFRELLKEFYSHSKKHPHGWGLLRRQDENYEIISEAVCASESKILDKVIDETMEQKLLLAHIRLATVGSLKQENTHPFTRKDAEGRSWNMIHNGTIYSGIELIPYIEKQVGDTDSERIILYLMDLLEEEYKATGSLSPNQRFAVVEKLLLQLAPRNKLNLILFDGEYLYVHKNMRNTLSIQRREEGILLATTPLNDGWEDLDICTLFVYKDGKLCYESTEKTEEFIPSLEYISAMAAMHI